MLVCCSDNDEFTLECNACDISIKNVSFQQDGNDNEGLININSGCVTIDNCEIRCVTNGVTVKSSGQIIMRDSKLHGAKVRVLYSTANDPQPQMIPRPQMIPKMDRK